MEDSNDPAERATQVVAEVAPTRDCSWCRGLVSKRLDCQESSLSSSKALHFRSQNVMTTAGETLQKHTLIMICRARAIRCVWLRARNSHRMPALIALPLRSGLPKCRLSSSFIIRHCSLTRTPPEAVNRRLPWRSLLKVQSVQYASKVKIPDTTSFSHFQPQTHCSQVLVRVPPHAKPRSQQLKACESRHMQSTTDWSPAPLDARCGR